MRKKLVSRVITMVILLSFGCSGHSFAEGNSKDDSAVSSNKTNSHELIIKLKSASISSQNIKLSKEIDTKLKSYKKNINNNKEDKDDEKIQFIARNNDKLLCKVESKASEDNVIRRLNENSDVEYVEPNMEYKVCDDSTDSDIKINDEYFNQQWAFQNSNIEKGLEYMKNTTESAIVAVVDTGVDYNHPDLKNRILKGKNFASKDGNGDLYPSNRDESDDYGHGTMVSGLISAQANNNVGIAGATYNSNVKILPIKVMNNKGYGNSFDIAQGIQYAADNNANIINLSIGDKEYSKVISDAIDYAQKKGCLVVAAAGNDGASVDDFYPAALPGVVAVGAIGQQNQVANFSNTGKDLSIVAPGVNIISSTIKEKGTMGNEEKGYYAIQNGTSFSAPYVSAAAALYKIKHPQSSPGEIKEAITNSADDLNEKGRDDQTGYGKLDMDKLLGSDSNNTVDSVKILQPQESDYTTSKISLKAQVLSNNDKADKVGFYIDKISEDNLIGEVSKKDSSDIYETSGDTSKFEDGTHSLIAVVYSRVNILGQTTQSIKIINKSNTGVLLNIKDPQGNEAANAQVMAFVKRKKYYTDTQKTVESYDLLWSGKTTSEGVVRIPNTEIQDLTEMSIVVQGNCDFINSPEGKTLFIYNRTIAGPGSYEIDGKNSVPVKFSSVKKNGDKFQDIKYYAAIIGDNNEILGESTALNNENNASPTIYMDKGKYNLFAHSEESDQVYLMSFWNKQIDENIKEIKFDAVNTGEVSLDTNAENKINNGIIYLYNDATEACVGINNNNIKGKKLLVSQGNYNYKVQQEVKAEDSTYWTYDFDGEDKKIDVKPNSVNKISVGKQIKLDYFDIDKDKIKSNISNYNDSDIKKEGDNTYSIPKNYKNAYIKERFSDSYGNKLEGITKEPLKKDTIQSYQFYSQGAGTSILPELKVTYLDGNKLLYDKKFAVFYDYSLWAFVLAPTLGDYKVEISLDKNPLSQDGIQGSMIHKLYEKQMNTIVLKDENGNALRPYVWIYKLDKDNGQQKWKQTYVQWSNGNKDQYGQIQLDSSLNLSESKNLMVLYYTMKNGKNAIVFRPFNSIKDLGNEIIINQNDLKLVKIEGKDNNGNALDTVRKNRQAIFPIKVDNTTTYVDQPLEVIYKDGIYMEKGSYGFSGQFTTVPKNGKYSNYYLINESEDINSDKTVYLDTQNTKKVDLKVNSDGYNDFRGASLIPYCKYNNIMTSQYYDLGINYYIMGNEFYLPENMEFDNIRLVMALGDKENPQKIWNYIIEKGENKLNKDITWNIGGKISAEVKPDVNKFYKYESLSGNINIEDEYKNKISNIYINENPNWLIQGKDSGVKLQEASNVVINYVVPTLKIYRQSTSENKEQIYSGKKTNYINSFDESIDNLTPGQYVIEISTPSGPNGVVTGNANIQVLNSDYSLKKVSEDFQDKDEIKSSYEISNSSSTQKQATLIIAIYDSNNKLVDYKFQTQNLEAKTNKLFNVDLKLPQSGDRYRAKVFIWDNFKNGNILLNKPVIKSIDD